MSRLRFSVGAKRLSAALALAALMALPRVGTAQDVHCSEPATCAAQLFDDEKPWPVYRDRALSLSAKDRTATAAALTRYAAERQGNRPDAIFLIMFGAAPDLRRDVVWSLLQDGSDDALFAAGHWISPEDEDDIRDRIAALPRAGRGAQGPHFPWRAGRTTRSLRPRPAAG